MYHELERYLLRDQVYRITAFQGYTVVPTVPNVKGMHVLGTPLRANSDFATVWLEKSASGSLQPFHRAKRKGEELTDAGH